MGTKSECVRPIDCQPTMRINTFLIARPPRAQDTARTGSLSNPVWMTGLGTRKTPS